MPTDANDSGTDPDVEVGTVAQLIRGAGRRESPPADAYRRVLEAATAALHVKTRRRRQRRWLGGIAATIVVGLLIALLAGNPVTPPAQSVARIDRIVGTAQFRRGGDGEWQTYGDDTRDLHAGDVIRTGAGSRVGLQLDGGVSLRLTDDTELIVRSASQLRLLTGTLYLDTGPAGSSRQLEVITDAGTVRDVGTQFEVRYLANEYRVRVREGRVLLQHGAMRTHSAAGMQLSIGTHGQLRQTEFRADDPAWRWVESVAPAPQIDEQPVSVLLAWVARETGRSIRFETTAAQQRAATTILHGAVRHLTPLEALSVMLATTDLDYELHEDGTILVRLKPSQ